MFLRTKEIAVVGYLIHRSRLGDIFISTNVFPPFFVSRILLKRVASFVTDTSVSLLFEILGHLLLLLSLQNLL